jgi:hypothetical protein
MDNRRNAMPTLFHITVRNADDEVMEFASTQPVMHIDIRAGRYLITVRCARSAACAGSARCSSALGYGA